MPDEPARRRHRRRRGGRRPVERPPLAKPDQRPAGSEPLAEWEWRSFPVGFAFALGLVVMALASVSPVLNTVFFFGGLFGVAFGLAHMLTRTIVARRRRRR